MMFQFEFAVGQHFGFQSFGQPPDCLILLARSGLYPDWSSALHLQLGVLDFAMRSHSWPSCMERPGQPPAPSLDLLSFLI